MFVNYWHFVNPDYSGAEQRGGKSVRLKPIHRDPITPVIERILHLVVVFEEV